MKPDSRMFKTEISSSSSSRTGNNNQKVKLDIPRPLPFGPQSFPMTSLDEALEFLDENGYAVLNGVLSEAEVAEGISLMWDFIEGLDKTIKRDDPRSFSSPKFPDPFGYGTVVGDGAGQSEFMWYCRGKENVQNIYRRIWKTDNLITSFDGFCLHRPWEYNQKWRTNDKLGYHLDQNGKTKTGKVCVQGFLNFFDAGVDDGGLVLVPGSHKVFNSIFKSRPALGADRMDFVRMTDDPSIWQGEIKQNGLFPIKVCCRPGDFVIWDSRVIHCAMPAKNPRQIPNEVGVCLPPRRLVAYICMTPSDRLSDQIRRVRVEYYKQGHTTSHWPEEATSAAKRRNNDGDYIPVQLSPSQRALVPI